MVAVPLGWATGDVAQAWFRHPLALWFGGGAVAGLLVGWFLERRVPFLPILEHELTHLLVALALFRKPRHLRVAESDGEVVYDGRGSTFIRLAPYAVPTLTLVALAFSPLVAAAWRPEYALLLGLTWGYHVFTSLSETRPHQPDLREGGVIPSFVAVATMGSVLFTLAALAAVGRTPMLERWFDHGYARARTLASLVGRASGIIGP